MSSERSLSPLSDEHYGLYEYWLTVEKLTEKQIGQRREAYNQQAAQEGRPPCPAVSHTTLTKYRKQFKQQKQPVETASTDTRIQELQRLKETLLPLLTSDKPQVQLAAAEQLRALEKDMGVLKHGKDSPVMDEVAYARKAASALARLLFDTDRKTGKQILARMEEVTDEQLGYIISHQ
jgi:hypothetical protein